MSGSRKAVATVPVLQGQKDFQDKTFRSMLHQMGISLERFLELLND